MTTPLPAKVGLVAARFIVVALAVGIAIFAGVSLVVTPAGNPPAAAGTLRMLAWAFTGGSLVVASGLRMMLLGGGREERNPYETEPRPPDDEPDDPALIQRFMSGTVVGCAMLEGPAIFAIIVSMITADRTLLAAAGLAIAAMLVVFYPTEARWRAFVRNHAS